jgi:hypothetical protein
MTCAAVIASARAVPRPPPFSRLSPCAASPLAPQTTALLRLLDQYGASALDAALATALARGAVNAASIAHLLDQRARARRQPLPLTVVLPADPRVRDLRVTPHALTAYDALLTPPTPPEETPDAPLPDTLKTLGLHHTAAHLEDVVALATKRRWSAGPGYATESPAPCDTRSPPCSSRRESP